MSDTDGMALMSRHWRALKGWHKLETMMGTDWRHRWSLTGNTAGASLIIRVADRHHMMLSQNERGYCPSSCYYLAGGRWLKCWIITKKCTSQKRVKTSMGQVIKKDIILTWGCVCFIDMDISFKLVKSIYRQELVLKFIKWYNRLI